MSRTNNLSQNLDFSKVSSDFETELKIEQLEGRQRHIFAKVPIAHPLEKVWQTLTDYEAFTEFMPGLTESKLLTHPKGGIRLEEVRTKNFMGMKFSFRSVFEIEEKFPHEIRYQLIKGDLKALSGYWRLEPWSFPNQKAGVDLIYDFLILPKPLLPTALVEHILSHDIPTSLLAIRQRIEKLSQEDL
jgi:ribosome-associated toxin RatA of RatAB toxin-antitoxin module